MAIQNEPQKGTINFFDKIAIFKGFGEGLGRVLGGIWEGLGRDLGRFGRILRSKSGKIMKKTLPKTVLFSITLFNQFRMALGRVWGGFGEGFGGFLTPFGLLLMSFCGA